MAATLALFALGFTSCQPSAPFSGSPGASEAPSQAPAGASDAHTIFAAGDIASCESAGDDATAELIEELLDPAASTVLALGDLAYEGGSAREFADCYDPSWGRFLSWTLPTPGNHEYSTPNAAGYFEYFREGPTGTSARWYSTRLLNVWWVVSLNSNCDEVGGCGEGSDQARYLEDLLGAVSAETPGACILAFWHHPRWSSGEEHGPDDRTDFLWRALADAGADIVLAGHDHGYERFVPMNADGASDPEGMTQFVVGTGGRSLYGFGDPLSTSAVRDSSAFGVLQLTLRDDGYDWAFISTETSAFADRGSEACG